MFQVARANPRSAGIALVAVLLALFAAAFGFVTTGAPHASAGHNAQGDAPMGVTDGWLDGETVEFFYVKDFFCKEPPTSGADSNCEVGAEAEVAPRPGDDIPVLYVMTPLGFRPDDATLQCPTVGMCINHPGTIDVSRIFGPGTESIPLPAHSHIVDVAAGGWWEIEVIGVFDPAVWDQIVAAKDLDAVRELQAAAAASGDGSITGDIPTNLYLFFNVKD